MVIICLLIWALDSIISGRLHSSGYCSKRGLYGDCQLVTAKGGLRQHTRQGR